MLSATVGGARDGETCWGRADACRQTGVRCAGDGGLEPVGCAMPCTPLLLDFRLPALMLLLPTRRAGFEADTRVADEAREASDAPPAPPVGNIQAT